MENRKKCPNSIKNKMIFRLAFHQIQFDWVLTRVEHNNVGLAV